MNALILLAAMIGNTPTPTGSADRTIAIYFSPSTPPPSAAAYALAGSATTEIYLASWQLTDGTLADALCLAASRSVAVRVALDLSTGTTSKQWALARQIKASGGTVWNCPIPHRVSNNFFAANGNYELIGNYYYSPTAVQEGAYLTAISGTNAPATAAATFTTLISGGTITSTEVKQDFQLCSLPIAGCQTCQGVPAWIPPPPIATRAPDACDQVQQQSDQLQTQALDFPDRDVQQEHLFLLSLIELPGRPRRQLFSRPAAGSSPPTAIDGCSPVQPLAHASDHRHRGNFRFAALRLRLPRCGAGGKPHR